MTLHHCTIEVRGYELDSFGHVNNAVYLNYLEHARWQMLHQHDITLEQITRERLWPVITGIEIRYLKPALMGDRLEVRTSVIERSRIRFSLRQQIFKNDAPIADAKVDSVVVNTGGRPVELPEYYNRLWS